jgi:glycine cleavage system regulatory protein
MKLKKNIEKDIAAVLEKHGISLDRLSLETRQIYGMGNPSAENMIMLRIEGEVPLSKVE